jgi:hypothetical protein
VPAAPPLQQHKGAAHLSVWLLRLLYTSTSSHFQVPPSGASMIAAMGPSSGATKLTSSTDPSCKQEHWLACNTGSNQSVCSVDGRL